MPQTPPALKDQSSAFALSARLRRTLPDPDLRTLLRDWKHQSPPLRGKLLGIDAVGLLLDVGSGAYVESFHLYLRKGNHWHRVMQVPGRSDGGRRLVARLDRTGCIVEEVEIAPRTGNRISPPRTLQTLRGDLVREQYLRLPDTVAPAPRRPR